MLLALFFPLIFNVLFNVLGSGRTVAGVSNAQFTTAAIVVFIISSTGYMNMAISIVVAREKSILKRIRQTPVPPLIHLVSRIMLATLISAVSVALMIVISMIAFGLVLPATAALSLVVTFLIGCFAFSALGMAVTRFIPTVESGMVIATATLFPLLFVSGVFIPIQNLPGWLDGLLHVLPVAPMNDAVRVAFASSQESVFALPQLGVLAAWAIVAMIVTLRTMPWEPHR
jgi:ABC-2 type transport system permease protein